MERVIGIEPTTFSLGTRSDQPPELLFLTGSARE
jgi:hypothetical protein